MTDSCDVGVEVGSYDAWRHVDDVSDTKLAQQLQLQAIESQLLQDAQLAEQLQLKENSYMTPRYVVCGGNHGNIMAVNMYNYSSNLVPKAPKISHKEVMKTAKLKSGKAASYKHVEFYTKSPLPPPLPPPPPPPPPPIRTHLPEQINRQRLQLMDHVRHYAGPIRHKLRPVVPVEKRAFRIGVFSLFIFSSLGTL